MKKIILLLLVTSLGYSQEIAMNDMSYLYSYSHVKENENQDLIIEFENSLKGLGYSNIQKSENNISGDNFFSVIIMGTPVQVHYFVFLEFQQKKYKLTVNKFVLEDRRWSPVPLENIKNGKSRWIKKINENLPKIITSIEKKADW
jgi:hypothetical protein